jgi:hypothetical protein
MASASVIEVMVAGSGTSPACRAANPAKMLVPKLSRQIV